MGGDDVVGVRKAKRKANDTHGRPHAFDGWTREAQWSSPPTVRKREQRVVIYQLSLRVSVPRATANDGAGIEGLALLLSRSIWRRLNPTTLCDGVVVVRCRAAEYRRNWQSPSLSRLAD